MEVEFTTGTKTEAQSNDVSTKIPCTATTAEATSTGSRNFYCPSRTAANVVSISGTDTAIKLAEVVIAGAAWGELILPFINLRFEVLGILLTQGSKEMFKCWPIGQTRPQSGVDL